jgi:hypothetical protein
MAKQVGLSVKERQQLAFRVLEQFNQLPLKKLEEYSSRNRTLINRANKLAAERSDVARAVLAQVGKSAKVDVSKRALKEQTKRAVNVLKPSTPKQTKQNSEGRFIKRDYTTKTVLLSGIKYKLITTTYPPFPPGNDVPKDDIFAYYHGEQLAIQEYGGYVVDPIKWINKVLKSEGKGFDIGNTLMQGIARTYSTKLEYKAKFTKRDIKSPNDLEIRYINNSYKEIHLISDHAEVLLKKFALVKQVQLKLREFVSKKRVKK